MTPETIEWIATADRMPEDEDVVVVYSGGWMSFAWRDDSGWRHAADYLLIRMPITHWAILEGPE